MRERDTTSIKLQSENIIHDMKMGFCQILLLDAIVSCERKENGIIKVSVVYSYRSSSLVSGSGVESENRIC